MLVVLGLGSNIGNREAALESAVRLLTERAGTLVALSDTEETEPWGFQSAHPFLNAVVAIDTPLHPYDLLAVTQQIERDLGRTAKTTADTTGRPLYHDRPIDIDILLWPGMRINDPPRLVIPHPAITLRPFVVQPLLRLMATLGQTWSLE